MNHGRKNRKLGRTPEHRKAMLRNLATSLVFHEQIKTTLPKAKELRRFTEKLMTKAKTDTVANRRRVARDIQNPAALQKLFENIGPRIINRDGGYLRVLRAGFRHGDCAEMAYIELVDRDKNEKGRVIPSLPAKARRGRQKKMGRGRGLTGGDA